MMAPLAASRNLLAIVLILLTAASVQAAPTREQLAKIAELRESIRAAGKLFVEEKFLESADLIKKTQAELEKLAVGADRQLLARLKAPFDQLERAHALLELEGITLPALKRPSENPPPTPTPGAVSFSKEVAPILVGKCGRCHVNNARGMFSMANFESLMRGPPAGVVVFKGDSAGSRLIEVIESGDMPRGGLTVTPDELAMLKKWIDGGAGYDGPNPQASLSSLAPNAEPSELPMVEIMQATGKETVLFSRDIAPVLSETCFGCHGAGQNTRANFNLTTFDGIVRGGDSGAVLAPGKPAESLLLKKLRGTAEGQRMPAGGLPPLADEVLAKIETWIKEGATFDGPDRGQNIRDVANLTRARLATHEQLSADRAELAAQNWRLGMPGINSAQTQTSNFLLVGGMGEAMLAEFGEQAEEVAPKIAKMFRAPEDKPLIKGRMTLYFFGQRYDYSEFGKMVEKRDLPREQRGHFRFTIIDAYGAMIPSRSDEYSIEALLGQQIAGAYIASLGQSPRWFSEGSARVAASKLNPTDSRVAAWDQRLPAVLASMSKPDDFLTGKLAPGDGDIASYSFVKKLMSDSRRYNSLLAALSNGASFDKAFAATYGGSPADVTAVWARTAAKDTERTAKQRRRARATGGR